jgi:GDP-L-fucose synthase
MPRTPDASRGSVAGLAAVSNRPRPGNRVVAGGSKKSRTRTRRGTRRKTVGGAAPHYLITGGTGFVGKHLVQELVRRGISFTAFSKREYDLTVWEQAQALFEANRHATVIIHLASYQAAGDFPAKHPAEQMFVNNSIHTNVLECWRRYAPTARLLAIGTSCAYPSKATSLREEVFLDGEIHGSVYAYAFTKRLLYTGILAYNDQFGLNGSYLIPATMFGEHDDFHPETAHVPGALIGKFVRAVREGLPEVEIWGDGSQVRDFVDVDEFVQVVLDLAERADRDILNIGPGAGLSIRELAMTVSEAAGFKGRLAFNPQRYVGIKEKFIDASRLRQRYGLSLSNNLRPALARTVAWYFANYERLKDRRKFGESMPQPRIKSKGKIKIKTKRALLEPRRLIASS